MVAESFPSAFHIEQYLADHDRLIAALERLDAPRAVAMMREHLRNVGNNLLGTTQIAHRLDGARAASAPAHHHGSKRSAGQR